MFARSSRFIHTGILYGKISWIALKRSFSIPSVRIVAEDVPVVVKKAAEKAVKEVAELEKDKVVKSTFSQRINPFLWGFILTSCVGIYLLRKDLNESNMRLQEVITAMKNDELAKVMEMEEKIKALEEKLN